MGPIALLIAGQQGGASTGGFDFNLSPDSNALPGGTVATNIVNGIGFYALLFCLVGLVLSAGLWAVGSFSSNYTQSVNGKKGFLICAGAALAIGAASYLIDYFAGAGNAVDGGKTETNGNGGNTGIIGG